IQENSVPYTRPAHLPPRARLRRHSRMIAGSPLACPLMTGCWCKPVSPYAKEWSVSLAFSIDGLWGDDIFRGSPRGCTTNQLWMGEGELSFAEAYGEELEVLGPLKVGRGYRFSFSYSVTDIEILANLTA